jgi:hypothetical protein
LPSCLENVNIFLVAPEYEVLENDVPGKSFVVLFALKKTVNSRLFLSPCKLKPEVIDSGAIKQGYQRLNKLGVVLDAMIFSEENDVVIFELGEDVIFGTLVVDLDILNEIGFGLGMNGL